MPLGFDTNKRKKKMASSLVQKKSPFLLLASLSILIFTQQIESTVAFGVSSLLGGSRDEIEELPESVDVYRGNEVAKGNDSYGLDVSFPITSDLPSDNYPWLDHNVDPENYPLPKRYQGMPIQVLGDKRTPYEELLEGCRQHYGLRKMACDSTEKDRIAMNKRQPMSVQNYTEIGFKKIKAPKGVFDLIKEFWEKNKDKQTPEKWNSGNTYTNHWVAPTYMVSVEDTGLRGGGVYLKNKIWDLAKTTLEEWTGEELTPCSLYGIRVYTENSVLATHVDRMPLVSSAILNVAQDVDEPWPIEVYGHDGKAYNVTMEPGDMVLYESHSILHGRPFPLKGRFYANIFIHFEPVGHSLRHNEKIENINIKDQYKDALSRGHGGHENNHGLPTYILDGSTEAKRWRATHSQDWAPSDTTTVTTGSTDAHAAAGAGDIDSLKIIAKKEKHQLKAKDINGWEPIHEGARGGHTEVLKILVQNGVNINERTNHGKGGSPLFLAMESHGKDHSSVKYLKSIGAEYIEAEL